MDLAYTSQQKLHAVHVGSLVKVVKVQRQLAHRVKRTVICLSSLKQLVERLVFLVTFLWTTYVSNVRHHVLLVLTTPTSVLIVMESMINDFSLEILVGKIARLDLQRTWLN